MSTPPDPDRPRRKRPPGARNLRSREGQQARARTVMHLLAMGQYKHDIKAFLAQPSPVTDAAGTPVPGQYMPGLGWRQAELVIAQARKLLREEFDKGEAEHQTDSYAFYRGVLNDPAVPAGTKIVARARIDALLGLQKPNVVHVKSSAVETADSATETLLARVRQGGLANPKLQSALAALAESLASDAGPAPTYESVPESNGQPQANGHADRGTGFF